MPRVLLPVLLVLVPSCREEPVISQPPVMFDGAPQAGFADTLIGYTVAGTSTVCSPSVSGCTGEPSAGMCEGDAAVAALGAADGNAFVLDANGRIEVAFRCGWIMEHPGPNGTFFADLAIAVTGDVPDGGAPLQAIVEVSYDGSTYVELGSIEIAGDTSDGGTTDSLSLTRIELDIARFVRIADRSGGGLGIDAIQAL